MIHMSFLLAIFGGMYATNYIDENIIDPITNKITEWKENIEKTIDEYNNKTQRDETNKIVEQSKETRERIKKNTI